MPFRRPRDNYVKANNQINYEPKTCLKCLYRANLKDSRLCGRQISTEKEFQRVGAVLKAHLLVQVMERSPKPEDRCFHSGVCSWWRSSRVCGTC